VGLADLSFSQGDKPSQIQADLARYKALLEQKPDYRDKYKEPYVERIYLEVLSHVNLDRMHIINVYSDQKYPYFQPNNCYILVHSHEVTGGCSRPTFCHVYGYIPSGDEHPTFIKAFYQKWPNLRQTVG
jgi:hypothetical protein